MKIKTLDLKIKNLFPENNDYLERGSNIDDLDRNINLTKYTIICRLLLDLIQL